jgi:hypothetical protein
MDETKVNNAGDVHPIPSYTDLLAVFIRTFLDEEVNHRNGGGNYDSDDDVDEDDDEDDGDGAGGIPPPVPGGPAPMVIDDTIPDEGVPDRKVNRPQPVIIPFLDIIEQIVFPSFADVQGYTQAFSVYYYEHFHEPMAKIVGDDCTKVMAQYIPECQKILRNSEAQALEIAVSNIQMAIWSSLSLPIRYSNRMSEFRDKLADFYPGYLDYIGMTT